MKPTFACLDPSQLWLGSGDDRCNRWRPGTATAASLGTSPPNVWPDFFFDPLPLSSASVACSPVEQSIFTRGFLSNDVATPSPLPSPAQPQNNSSWLTQSEPLHQRYLFLKHEPTCICSPCMQSLSEAVSSREPNHLVAFPFNQQQQEQQQFADVPNITNQDLLTPPKFFEEFSSFSLFPEDSDPLSVSAREAPSPTSTESPPLSPSSFGSPQTPSSFVSSLSGASAQLSLRPSSFESHRRRSLISEEPESRCSKRIKREPSQPTRHSTRRHKLPGPRRSRPTFNSDPFIRPSNCSQKKGGVMVRELRRCRTNPIRIQNANNRTIVLSSGDLSSSKAHCMVAQQVDGQTKNCVKIDIPAKVLDWSAEMERSFQDADGQVPIWKLHISCVDGSRVIPLGFIWIRRRRKRSAIAAGGGNDDESEEDTD